MVLQVLRVPPSTDAAPRPPCWDVPVRSGPVRIGARREDLGYAAVYLAAGLLLAFLPEFRVAWGTPDGDGWADALAVALACLGVTQRQARPLLGLALGAAAVALGAVLTQAVGVGVVVVFADLLYSAVRFGSHRASRAVGVGAAVLLALATLAGLLSDGPAAAVRVLLTLSMVLAVPVLWAREVRQHRELADAEHERAEQARRVAELDRAAAVAAERARMARDLHDVVAGQLSGIALQSEAALTVADAPPATLRRVLADVRRDSVAALGEMRAMIGLLRADVPPDPRTAPAGLDRLDALLAGARARGLRVRADDARAPGAPLPAAVDLTAYRIVQEALTNAAKHAPGSAVEVLLRATGGELAVEVRNDLVPGAAPGGGTGSGLAGLAERARAVGGRVTAGEADGRWSVRAVLPVGAPAVHAEQR
jgi:signal transduction histidine kinase